MKVLTAKWLIDKGFKQTDRYDFKKDGIIIRFTSAGCLLANKDIVEKFDGYIEDMQNIWTKHTGENL